MDRRRWVVAAGGLLLAAAVFGSATVAGQRYINPERIASPDGDDGSSAQASEDPSREEETPSPGQADFVDFESEDAGFAISHPKGWERIETPEESRVELVVTPDDKTSLQVSLFEDLGVSVGPDELPAMRQYTERLVRSGQDVSIVAGPSSVELDGLTGYVYVYTFTDQETGETGVHSHYFLFDGDRMFTLVFQALPQERYSELAPLFDAMAQSFRRR